MKLKPDERARLFTDPAEYLAFEDQMKAEGRFVRSSARRVRVTNRVAPAAAAHRPRYHYTVVFRSGQ